MGMKYKRCTGLGLLGWIISIPLVMLGVLILVVIFFEGRKAYWDHRVKKLCEKDGGIKIYKTVQLDENEYSQYINQFGELSIPRESNASEKMNYIRYENREFIRRNHPTVSKYELIIKRQSDNKILGIRISYSRLGGDIFSLDSSSSFRCPEKIEDLFKAVLTVDREE